MADITNILAMGPRPTTEWQNPLDLAVKQQEIKRSQAAIREAEQLAAQRQAEMDRQRVNAEAARKAMAEAGDDHSLFLKKLGEYGATPDLINQTRTSIASSLSAYQQAKDHELDLHLKQNKRKADIIDSVMSIQDAHQRPLEYKRRQAEAAREGVTDLPNWESADQLDFYRRSLGIEGAMAEQERLKRAQAIQQQQADATTQNAETNANRFSETQRANLRKAGLKINEETGETENIPYEEMSDTEKAAFDDKQAVTELRRANTEKAQAEAEYKKAQAEGDPIKLQLAQARLAVSQQNAQNAVNNFNARYRGLLPEGQYIPGLIKDEAGNVIPPVNTATVRPTATSKTAAERADTLETLDQRIRAALSNPELKKGVGPLAGRLKELEGRLGTLPRDLAELKNDLVSYGAFQAGLHPVRGIGAMQYFDQVLGGLGQTPEQLLGKMDSNLATARAVQRTGKANTTGRGETPKTAPKAPLKYNLQTGQLEPNN